MTDKPKASGIHIEEGRNNEIRHNTVVSSGHGISAGRLERSLIDGNQIYAGVTDPAFAQVVGFAFAVSARIEELPLKVEDKQLLQNQLSLVAPGAPTPTTPALIEMMSSIQRVLEGVASNVIAAGLVKWAADIVRHLGGG